MSLTKHFKTQRITWVFLILAFLLYLGFGIFHLGKFQTADEDLWLGNPDNGRVEKYWNALARQDWGGTRINDKPGVTTAIVAGIGLPFAADAQERVLDNSPFLKRFAPEANVTSFFFFRLPILLLNGLLVLLIFWLLYRYTQNELLALVASILLFLSPILLGISQIVNPDATVWSFGFVSLLSWLSYLKTLARRFLLLAGMTLGLALLSKYSAIYFLLFAYFSLYAHFLFHIANYTNPKMLAHDVRKALSGFLGLFGLALLVFVFLMPAALIFPEYLYQGTFGFRMAADVLLLLIFMGTVYCLSFIDAWGFEGRGAFRLLRSVTRFKVWLVFLLCVFPAGLLFVSAVNWSLGNFLMIPKVPFDLGRFGFFFDLTLWQKIWLELRALPFTVPPLVLFFALWALFRASMRDAAYRFLIFLLGAFMTFFYVAVLVQDLLLSVRYGIFLYPAMSILAALGLWDVVAIARTLLRRYLIVAGIIVAIIPSLWMARPFYFNYTSTLLPKDTLVTGAWGYGGYEAAQVLNTLPNAQQLMVWSDYDGFCPFFVGQCLRGTLIKKYADSRYREIDYFIKTRRGSVLNKGIWRTLKRDSIIEPNPFWTLIIGGRPSNYVQIYQARH